MTRVTVPEGQTPLDDKLGHRLLDVFREGQEARKKGTGSPYHGHSLEHCIHAAGWVQQDLRMALDMAQKATVENYREPGELGEGATVRRAEATRPIVGIENRTAKEVFDIMCARIHTLNTQVKADHACEIERLQTENASLRHSSLVARLSHEQLNRFIRLFDGAGFKGHQVDVQAKMAVEEIERLRGALRKIAAYDDAAANAYLRATGSYRCFDEPGAVEMARVVLEGRNDA